MSWLVDRLRKPSAAREAQASGPALVIRCALASPLTPWQRRRLASPRVAPRAPRAGRAQSVFPTPDPVALGRCFSRRPGPDTFALRVLVDEVAVFTTAEDSAALLRATDAAWPRARLGLGANGARP